MDRSSPLTALRDYTPPELDAEAEQLRKEGRRSRRGRARAVAVESRPTGAAATEAPLSVSSLVFGLLFLLFGISMYMLWQRNDVQGGALDRHGQRLAFLERSFDNTSETFSDVQRKTDSSLSDVEKLVGKNAGEVKKLWDLAWQRNQRDIKKQNKAAEAAEKALQATSERLAGTQSELKRAQESLLALQASAKDLARADGNIEEVVSEALAGVNEVKRLLRELSSDQAKLRVRLTQIAQWQRSVDIYRRGTNSRLDELRSRLVAR